MENDRFSCNVCSVDYDTTKHAPRILVDCGHTLCSQCLTRILTDPKLKKCPFDNRPFNTSQTLLNNFPFNYALIALFEEENKQNLCKIHNEKLTLVCLTDKIRICAECALFGDHKDHKMKRMKELRAQGLKTKEILKEGLENINREKAEKEGGYEEIKAWLLNEMGYQMNEMKHILKAKQLEWRSELESFFEMGRIGELSSLKKQADQAIKDIDSACQDDTKWTILEKDYSSLTEKLQSPAQGEHFLKISGHATEMWNSINKFFAGQKKAILEFELPNQGVIKELAPLEKNTKRVVRVKTRLRLEYTSESLTLSFREGSPKDIEINLEEYKETENVVIQISGYEHLVKESSEEAHLLYYLLSKLEKYASLMIFFDPHGFTEHHFFKLLSAVFCGIQHVVSLGLNLDKCDITANSFLVLCSRILSQAIHLKSLRLSLYSSQIDNACLLALSICLEPLKKNLEVLSLNLGKTEINDDGIRQILNLMEAVQGVELLLQQTGISDLGLKEFGEKILGTKLKELKLDVSETMITNEGMISIFRGLEKGIKVLNIRARRVEITGEVFDVFIEEIVGKLEGELEELEMDLEKGKIELIKQLLMDSIERRFQGKKKAEQGQSYLTELLKICETM